MLPAYVSCEEYAIVECSEYIVVNINLTVSNRQVLPSMFREMMNSMKSCRIFHHKVFL